MQNNFKKKYRLDMIFPILLVMVFSLSLLFQRYFISFSTNRGGKEDGDSLTFINNKYGELLANKNDNYNESALVIYEESNIDSVNTKNNVSYVLKSISVNVTEITLDQQSKYPDLSKFDTIVICFNNFDDLYYNFYKLSTWVNNGGGLVIANDLLNVPELDEYRSLIGFKEEEEIYESQVDSVKFLDDYLMNSKGLTFDESVISSTCLETLIIDEANVHAVTNDADQIPLIWDFQYGNGYVSVSNSNILTGKQTRGIFMAMYSSVHPVYVYPVINSAMYCIDDFPSPIPLGYDDAVYNDYGYTVFDFYNNVWWPSIVNLINKYGIKFTGFTIQTYKDETEGPFNSDFDYESSRYFANALLNVGGEVGIHGYNHQPYAFDGFDYEDDELPYVTWKSEKDIVDSFRTVINYTKSLTKNADVTSYVAPSNIISKEGLEILRNNFPEIKAYAGVYLGGSSSMLQEYKAYESGVVDVPRIVSNMSMDDFENFTYINELSYHFVSSHFIHPDDILDPDRSLGKKYSELLVDYEDMIENINKTGIRNTTVIEGGAATQRYYLTTVNRKYDDNKLILDVNGIYDEVYYMLKTNGKSISNITGASYRQISGDYYLLTISDSNVTIEME